MAKIRVRIVAGSPLPVVSFMLLCCAADSFAGVSTGEQSVATVTIPPMVVTSTRDERPDIDTPSALSLLESSEMRIERPARSVPEAFGDEPGIMVQKTAHGQGSPYIRGFTGYRNLFMIDGVRLNNSVFRDGPNQYWNTVDALGVSRIEVVRGPASMLYGSDAVGGTVNAITRGIGDLRPGSDADRNLYFRYSSAEDSIIGRIESIGRLTENSGLTLGLTCKDFGDLKGGADVGRQRRTGYDELDWDAKFELFLSDDAFLVLSHQRVDLDDAWRTHKTVYGIDWEGLSIGSELRRVLDQDRELTLLQYHGYAPSGFIEECHMGLSHQLQSEERDRLRTEDRHDLQGVDVRTFGAFLSMKSSSPLGRLVYGAEYYHDAVDSFSRTLNPDGSGKSISIQGPVGDDASYDLMGVYLQDELSLSDRMALILGGRYEFARADADSVADPDTGTQMAVTEDWDDFVASARLIYHLDADKRWALFGGVSQGVRMPNLSDLTRFDSARTDEFETPSPDLDPEHFISCEAGIKARTSDLSLQLACFHTDIDGMIIRTPTGRIVDGENEVTKMNGGDGFIGGVELDGRYRVWREWALFGSLTWLDGESEVYPTSDATIVTEPVDRLMPPTGRAGLAWNTGGKYWAEAECTVAGKSDRLSTRDRADTSRIPPGGTPGYTVFDIRAGWSLSDVLALSVAVENVTDEDYRIHGSGLNEPGRNLVLAGQCTF